MKKHKILLLSLSVCLLASCSNKSEELDSMVTEKKWRAMFITDRCWADMQNNDLHLEWYGVNDAAGYVIQTKYRNGDFDEPIFSDTLPPDQNMVVIEDLQYGAQFMTRIKVLSPLGPAYDSEWFGQGPGGENEMYLTVRARYAVPKIIRVSDVKESSLRINLVLSDNLPFLGADDQMYNYIPPVYGRANGEFIVDSLAITPKAGNANAVPICRKITQEEKDQGYIDISGLLPNTTYSVNVLNATTPDMRKWDRYYNTVNIRTKGGDPVIVHIPWVLNEEDPGAMAKGLCRIDTILLNYYNDPELPEGTIFELDPGQKYYIGNWYTGSGGSTWGVMPIEKGFTLRTKENPDGTIAGNGQKARMIHTYGTGPNGAGVETAGRRGYWQFGRDAQPGELGQLLIGEIIFKNLSCEGTDVIRGGYHGAGNAWVGATPNLYFSCNEGVPMSARVEKWEMESCDFIGFSQGIFKIKGSNGKVLDSLVVNNCTFYGGGYGGADGSGNSFFKDDSNDWKSTPSTSNMFKNFIFTNNTIWDNPLQALIDHASTHPWGSAEIAWNIVIENNTFINFAPLASGTKGIIFDFNNPPAGKLTVKKNLFVMTQKKIDWVVDKKLTAYSMGIRIQGLVNPFTYDFADNYCTTEFFFSSLSFSSISPGSDPSKGTNQISATELFTAPDITEMTSANYETMKYFRPDINASLRYQNTAKVKNSDIYTKGIGDPRWRTGVTP